MKTLVKELDVYVPTAQLFDACYEDDRAVFLDSSLVGNLGQYSIIGRHPYLTLLEKDGVCYRNGEAMEVPFEAALKAYLQAHQEENVTDLPLISGAIGYLTYDYGRKFEQIASRHTPNMEMPAAYMTFYDTLFIEDCREKRLFVAIKGELMDADQRLQEVMAWIARLSLATPNVPTKHGKLAEAQTDFTKAEYQEAVQAVIDYIVEGDIYITNMTQQLRVAATKHPYEVFRYLRAHNPSPFGGYFNGGDFQIVCASPERFMKVKDGVVETRPIKGTRKRGATPEEDKALYQELAHSEKDKSELLMIVDLERNDLNHVCVPGSVQVTELFEVETYATVFHLVSTIVGQLRDEVDVVDLLRAAFPGGSITGAPKIRSMEIIDELERCRRGLYTGAIGYVTLDGACDFNIVIRTAIHQDGTYYLGVGGGITCESETEFEYEETLQKAKAVLEAIYENHD